MVAVVSARWTPNQEAARRRIVEAAARLIAEEGLEACTFRAVAGRAGLTKSTVHYYFDDANELVDLSVAEIMGRLAGYATERVKAAPNAGAALEFLVRLFVNPAEIPAEVVFRDSMLWSAYVTHAWRRGAKDQILLRLDTLCNVFRLALERAAMDPAVAAERAGSIHNYLLGAMIRNMIHPLDRNEVARAIGALSGLPVNPAHC